MSAGAKGNRSGPTARWLMPLLLGSLALNLVVVGAAVALLWRGQLGREEVPLSQRVVPSVLGYAVTLPPERVKELEQLTKEEWERVQPLRQALLAARDASNKALAAEPFDLERYRAAQAHLVVADQASRTAAFKLHSAIALHLTPEERRGYLRWREQRRRKARNPLDARGRPSEVPER